MKSKKQNGITLVALVITIVAMLILAGITINLTIGQDGIITKAQEAGEKQKIGEYRDKIELAKIDVESESLGEITLDKLLNKLYEKKIIPEGSAKILDDGKSAQITTPDGYIFIITIEKTDYIGKGDKIEAPPDLQEGDVTFTLDSSSWDDSNKNTWTKEDVTVTIQTKEAVGSGLTLQYSLDGSNWIKYTQPFVVKQNTTVYACLTNIIDKQGKYATTDITIIDKLAPEEFTPAVTANTNSVTVDASGAKDAEKTKQYGQSGIGEIWYKLDDGEWVTNTDRTQTSYTYNNLTQNTSYTIQVKAIDNAGNETIIASQTVSTLPVTGIQTGDVTFGFEPSEETKENVAVTISGNNTGYTLQYKTEKTGASGEVTDWTNYTGAITVTRNQDIYARVVDSTGQYANTTATGTVANIDKLPPNSFTPSASSTTNSITVTASATDQAKTSDNASSGIGGYSFRINGGSWSSYQTSGSYTFNNLTQNTSYTIQVKAKDKVGNEKESASQTVSTIPVTGIQTGDVTFSYSPSGATKGNVAVTISGNNTGYTLQYKTEKTGASGEVTNWTNYTGAITVTRNQDIYARVVDSTGQYANTTATGTVANIDKLPPNSFTPSASSTTNSITVTASATDQAKTSDNASSGIGGYSFRINGGSWSSYQTSGSYTFNNLTQNTSYTIQVKAKDKVGNEKESASQSVTTQKQLVTGISLNKTSTTIAPGKTETLTATITPNEAYNKAVTWTSNNTSVATVNSSGVVTGASAGTATITVAAQDGSGKTATCSVTVTNPTLASKAKPGDYVEYDGGNGYAGLWRVLYNDSTYGLQIISDTSVGDYILGGSTDAEAKTSYNNAVNQLNSYCAKYVNTSYATGGRCVGSNPLSPADATTYETLQFRYNGSYDSGCKVGDTNYETDYNAMKAATNQSSSGIHNIGAYYCLASRFVDSDSSYAVFDIRYVDSNGDARRISLWYVYPYGNSGQDWLFSGVRPVITLKSGIQTNSGNGSSGSPFKLVAM